MRQVHLMIDVLSIAKASNTHWEQGVVRNPSSSALQSIRRIYPSKVVMSNP